MKNLKSLAALIALLLPLGISTASAADAPVGNAVEMDLQVDIPKDAWRYQFYQNSIPLELDQNYLLTFWAKADRPVEFAVAAKQSAPPWGFLGLNTSTYAGTEWKLYRMPFAATKAIPGKSRISFSLKEKQAVKIWIADVKIVPAGPAGKDAANMVRNPRFEQGFGEWYSEGTKVGVYSVQVVQQSAIPAAAAE
ncbi:hypothetical protein H5P28_15055 [Ruficoccus amylovorans]|uniref:Uncharacterized protein n=1 Tax=Ruficoccus amylovorans TaxID=1804625 RepID=A0A842HJ01_9BACT|nr:hypothetical protein [Ruficoccus amylovorans]MBC2595584.1 hypothetical protein [Ruficoccus amylovorans]